MLEKDSHKFSYESMGTRWEIAIWDPHLEARLSNKIIEKSKEFDNLYSRFIKDSLVWKIAENPGKHEVPADLVKMLRLYEELYLPSEKKLNPLIGFAISDLGYDAEYSLKKIKPCGLFMIIINP
ncbi:FAD:protein FMN transferase [Candidatus Giovannonibacteria bacterium]|nr:FAD:protein FMN transferase [Candidatus Giovannonibacteria bacterium]